MKLLILANIQKTVLEIKHSLVVSLTYDLLNYFCPSLYGPEVPDLIISLVTLSCVMVM